MRKRGAGGSDRVFCVVGVLLRSIGRLFEVPGEGRKYHRETANEGGEYTRPNAPGGMWGFGNGLDARVSCSPWRGLLAMSFCLLEHGAGYECVPMDWHRKCGAILVHVPKFVLAVGNLPPSWWSRRCGAEMLGRQSREAGIPRRCCVRFPPDLPRLRLSLMLWCCSLGLLLPPSLFPSQLFCR